MKNLLITTALLLTTLVLIAQDRTEIKGIMYDGETLHSLRDGHIYIEGTSIGTISNQFGHFKIDIPESMKDETLKISYVGYKTIELKLKEIKDPFTHIVMVPKIIQLPEIVIRADEPTAIDEAIARIREESGEYDKNERGSSHEQ